MRTIRKQELRHDEVEKLTPAEQLRTLVSAHNTLAAETLDASRTIPSVQVLSFPVRTGATVANSFPITLKLGANMPEVPLSVSIARIENQTDTAPTWTVAPGVFWEKAGARQILIRYVAGLSASKQYVIHLLVQG